MISCLVENIYMTIFRMSRIYQVVNNEHCLIWSQYPPAGLGGGGDCSKAG